MAACGNPPVQQRKKNPNDRLSYTPSPTPQACTHVPTPSHESKYDARKTTYPIAQTIISFREAPTSPVHSNEAMAMMVTQRALCEGHGDQLEACSQYASTNNHTVNHQLPYQKVQQLRKRRHGSVAALSQVLAHHNARGVTQVHWRAPDSCMRPTTNQYLLDRPHDRDAGSDLSMKHPMQRRQQSGNHEYRRYPGIVADHSGPRQFIQQNSSRFKSNHGPR